MNANIMTSVVVVGQGVEIKSANRDGKSIFVYRSIDSTGMITRNNGMGKTCIIEH